MSDAAPSLPATDARTRNGRAHGLPVFLLALLIGVGAHVAALGIFSVRISPPVPPEAPPSFINFTKAADPRQDKLMREAAEIFDPRNAYLPTDRNYASQDVRTAPPAQPLVFKADANNVVQAPTRQNFQLLRSSGSQPAVPDDALKPAPWDFMGALGRAPDASAKPAPHGALLRVIPQQSRAGASAVQQITWPADMAPKAGNARWQPATFTLVFQNIGLIGEPVIVTSSGVQAVDDDLRAKLKDWFRRHPLPAGYYTVEIGQ